MIVEHAGRHAVVRRSERHPTDYLFLDVDEGTYFLGVFEKGMTRGDVKRMAVKWMERHANRRTERDDGRD